MKAGCYGRNTDALKYQRKQLLFKKQQQKNIVVFTYYLTEYVGWVYAISTLVGYLIPNPLNTYVIY